MTELTASSLDLSGHTNGEVCAAFTQSLMDNDIDQAMVMLTEHPWLALEDAPSLENIRDSFKNRPYLHVAIFLGSEALINAMLDLGAPLERWDSERMTALFVTMHKGPEDFALRERIAWNLVHRGARCDARHSSGLSLAYANQGNYSDKLFHHVVAHGAQLTGQIGGTTFLARQVQNTYRHNRGLNSVMCEDGSRTHHEALQHHRLRLRIEAGADLRHKGQSLSEHCLAKPLEYNDLDMADLMVVHGADPLAKDDQGHNFLHWFRLEPTAVRWLVSKGVELEAQNIWGETPIMRQMENLVFKQSAGSGVDYSPVIALMTAGADLDAIDTQGPGQRMTARAWIEAEKDEVDLQNAYRALQARQTAVGVIKSIVNDRVPIAPGARC